jgi:feruloyl esterase
MQKRGTSFRKPLSRLALRDITTIGSAIAAALTLVTFDAAPGLAASCASLASLSLPNTVVTSATKVAATTTTPAFCNVFATVAPQTDIQVQLPDNWQRRYLHLGGGGFDGVIATSAPAAVNVNLLANGFAVAASNGGHRASQFPGASFAGDRTLVLGYAHTALSETDRVARALIKTYYGMSARHRYFDGCSNGGKNASIAASLLRDDYDGVIGGDGVYGHSDEHVGGGDMAGLTAVWVRAVEAASVFNPATFAAKMTALYNAEVAQCDALDGLVDGIISNPSMCHFDPASTQCPAGTDTPSCLTEDQVDAIKTVMSDLILDGKVIGAPYGLANFNSPIGGLSGGGAALGQGFLAMAYGNPNFPISSFNLEDDFSFIAAQLDNRDEMDGPLDEIADYVRDGGKLIIWSGGEDQLVPTADSVRFVNRLMGVLDDENRGDGDDRDHGRDHHDLRLYTLPGVGHCGGGPGADAIDLLTPMVNWVEHGVAPETLTASKVVGGTVTFTRPLCVFPKWPKYDGSGDPNDAASFTCVAPDDHHDDE